VTAAGADPGAPAAQAAEDVVRTSYGRLVAYLAATTHDVAAAEDALADALLAALSSWPERGVPDRPEAWLLTTARRRLIGRHRHDQVAAAAAPTLQLIAEEADAAVRSEWAIPDKRLQLCFVCAHPAIDAKTRAPLMLQVVLGLDAARIASAFMVAPATMGQRLSRAKAKIRTAGIAFAVPGRDQLGERVDSVLEAIYGAFGDAWSDPTGTDPRRAGLAAECIRLASILIDLLPDHAEPPALAATLHFAHARRHARRDSSGRYVPLAEQDPRRWDPRDLVAAEAHLAEAARLAPTPGRFQLEAAIQSLHAKQVITGEPEWPRISDLYDRLLATAPTIGAAIAAAAAIAQTRGADAGLRRLAGIESDRVTADQSYWAVAAHLHHTAGHATEAIDAYDRAAGLSTDPSVRQHLLGRKRLLADPRPGVERLPVRSPLPVSPG
jgi:predicted RNA polymerase sigma factor